jgi:pseudouridine-5'-monophosphatase
MQVVAVPDRRVSKEKVKGATIILNSLIDFKPEDFGLQTFNEE